MLIAGGTTGGCQVVCEQLHCSYLMHTNQPSVITDIQKTHLRLCKFRWFSILVTGLNYGLRKICLQGQGEVAKAEGAVPQGVIYIIQALGLTGLYKEAVACFLHDTVTQKNIDCFS